MCINCEGNIAFINEMPAIDCKSGIFTFGTKSGDQRRLHAIPIWLVRLIYQRMGELLAKQDANTAA